MLFWKSIHEDREIGVSKRFSAAEVDRSRWELLECHDPIFTRPLTGLWNDGRIGEISHDRAIGASVIAAPSRVEKDNELV